MSFITVHEVISPVIMISKVKFICKKLGERQEKYLNTFKLCVKKFTVVK